MKREQLRAAVTSWALQSVCVSGRAHRRRWGILIWKVLRRVAVWHVTLNLLSPNVLSGGGRELLLAPSPPPLPVLPPHPFLWHLHVLFMPSIFKIIPNLIAVSLLLPAAAAPKIKSSPRKEMLGWSFLIDQMLCCSKNSGHQVPSEADKLLQTCRCWISNMIILIGQQEHLYINIFEHFPRVDWQH